GGIGGHGISFRERPRPHDGPKKIRVVTVVSLQVGSALPAGGVRPGARGHASTRRATAARRDAPKDSSPPRSRLGGLRALRRLDLRLARAPPIEGGPAVAPAPA